MNDQRRKTLREAAELVGRAQTLVEIARDEERGAFDNLPESLQGGSGGQAIEAAAETLEELVDELLTAGERLEELAGQDGAANDA